MELDNALRLGRELMAQHGIGDWTLAFDRAKRRAGMCRYDTRTISISRHLTELHSEADVRDTLLHEIAHALVGPGQGHGPTWRKVARSLGCSAQRALSPDVPTPEAPWVGTCPAGHEHSRFRRPPGPRACRLCSRTFSMEHLLTWTFHGQSVDLGHEYARSLARSYQREEQMAALAALASVAGPEARGGLLTPGTSVMLAGTGRWSGMSGRVIKRGRTRYHVRTQAGVVTAPFALVVAL